MACNNNNYPRFEWIVQVDLSSFEEAASFMLHAARNPEKMNSLVYWWFLFSFLAFQRNSNDQPDEHQAE
jgi:hypothetical protein